MRPIDLFDRAAALYPDNAFLIQGNVVRRYRDALEATHHIATMLRAELPDLGESAGFLMPNHWRGIEALYGVFRAGHPIAPLNTRNPVSYHVDHFENARTRILFFHSQFTDTVKEILRCYTGLRRAICLDSNSPLGPSLAGWIGEKTKYVQPAPVQPTDAWAVFGTSGTTGQPKYVVQTHLTSIALCWDMLFALRAHEPMRHLVVAPVSHFAGSFLFALTGVGSTHHIHSTVNAEAILRTVEEERIEILFLPPTVINMLLNHPQIRDFDCSSLKALVYAGAPMRRSDVLQAMEVFGPVLMNMLGQTEANGPIAFLRPEEHRPSEGPDWDWRLLSVGRPSITRQVEVMSDAGEVLGAGEVGEVVIRGWGNSAGYRNNETATGELMKHGWLHTGDVGIKDEAGNIRLMDRKKDMIISGGYNIFCTEVEQTLLDHADVVGAAVIGVPHDHWGEAVKAIVELAPEATVDQKALIDLCKRELGGVKAPKSVEFRDVLPRNAAGKILKRELREPYWRSHERSI